MSYCLGRNIETMFATWSEIFVHCLRLRFGPPFFARFDRRRHGSAVSTPRCSLLHADWRTLSAFVVSKLGLQANPNFEERDYLKTLIAMDASDMGGSIAQSGSS